jgi:hypothetical protein
MMHHSPKWWSAGHQVSTIYLVPLFSKGTWFVNNIPTMFVKLSLLKKDGTVQSFQDMMVLMLFTWPWCCWFFPGDRQFHPKEFTAVMLEYKLNCSVYTFWIEIWSLNY